MLTRRTLLQTLGALPLSVHLAEAQAGGPRTPVFQHDLPDINLADWAVTAVEVSYKPGEGSNAHRHPGITIAYVLEGEIASKVGDDPEKTYTVGQMFIEMPQQVHAVSRNASDTKPARLLAILMAKKGQPLTTPVKG